jgi:TolB-like protein/DNA-binding winged helix-turn-helix (wHTH) protein/tetratricopeptide (TPR) repeat protein
MAESLSGAAIASLGGGGFMSEPELHAQKVACRGYVFDDFTLDLDRGCLWRAGQEVKLRFKSFEALKYLVERSGRVVGKEEMMRALWPDAFVTDDSLVQCLIEARRALGDDTQRYVKTVPRRGYLFNAPVSESGLSASGAPNPRDAANAVIEKQEYNEENTLPEVAERNDKPSSISDPSLSRRRSNSAILPAVIIAALLLAGLTGALVWMSSRPRQVKTVAEVRSIAVLPFRSIDAGSGDEYLGLGMADDLITRLSNLRQVTVRPTSAVRKYVGEANTPNPVVVGQELDVESVLESSIRRSGDRIRVTAQLVNVRDGAPLWAEKFDEKFTDILSVQDAVAEHVSQALLLQLTGAERMLLTKRYTNNPEAYQHYLKGRYSLTRRTESDYQKCIESFQQAIKLDQKYAPAYAGLADAYNIMGLYVFALSYPRDVFPKAKEAAAEALKIDSELGEAHSALAFAKLNYDWDWPEVEREFKRAIDLKPDNANLQHYYSHYWTAMGQREKSIAASSRALELGQFDLVPLNAHLGWHYLYSGDPDRAIKQLLKTIELEPNFVTSYLYLGFAYEQKGMNDAAIAEFSKAMAISGDGRRPVMEAALGHAYAVAGKRAEAQRVLDRLKEASKHRFISPYGIALIYLGLGDKEQAFAWLDRAYDERDNWLNYLKVEPRLDPLRSDARFTALLRRVGLSP